MGKIDFKISFPVGPAAPLAAGCPQPSQKALRNLMQLTVSEGEYAEFVNAYGFDISRWDGFSILSAVRELGMTTWLMQLAGQDAARRDEFHRRVDDLRSGKYPRRWRPF
jgi:hypothetical protein